MRQNSSAALVCSQSKEVFYGRTKTEAIKSLLLHSGAWSSGDRVCLVAGQLGPDRSDGSWYRGDHQDLCELLLLPG